MLTRKWIKITSFLLFGLGQFACSTKYTVKTYPAGAQVYTRDLVSNEKKLVGVSPVEIAGEAKLGDVFFLVVEKQNYKPKEILVRASEGETLSINAKLDPMTPDEIEAAKPIAKKDDDKKDPPQPPQDPKKKKDKELEDLIEELKLRVALLAASRAMDKQNLTGIKTIKSSKTCSSHNKRSLRKILLVRTNSSTMRLNKMNT